MFWLAQSGGSPAVDPSGGVYTWILAHGVSAVLLVGIGGLVSTIAVLWAALAASNKKLRELLVAELREPRKQLQDYEAKLDRLNEDFRKYLQSPPYLAQLDALNKDFRSELRSPAFLHDFKALNEEFRKELRSPAFLEEFKKVDEQFRHFLMKQLTAKLDEVSATVVALKEEIRRSSISGRVERTLTDTQRRLLQLRLVQGRDKAVAARELGISSREAGRQLRKALESLGPILGGLGDA